MSYVVQFRGRKSNRNMKWRTIGPFVYPTREHAVIAARTMFPHGFPCETVRFRQVTKG